jgi:ankyrin repeat protein
VLAIVLAAACRHAHHGQRATGTPDALFAAARAGDSREVERLLNAGVPVDAGDRYAATALAMAAGRGHLEVVRLLLDRGADPDRRETFFRTSAFDQALENEHLEIARLLLERGVDQREDALAAALERDLPDLARAAVDAGPIHASALEELRQRAPGAMVGSGSNVSRAG